MSRLSNSSADADENENESRYSKKIELIMEDITASGAGTGVGTEDNEDFQKFASTILSFKRNEMLESDAIVQLAHMIRRKVNDVILGLNAYLSDGYEIVKVKKKEFDKGEEELGNGNGYGGRDEHDDEDEYQLFYRTPMDDKLTPLLASDVRMQRVINQLKEYKMLIKRRSHQNTQRGRNDTWNWANAHRSNSPSKNMSWKDPKLAYGTRHGKHTQKNSRSVRQYESSTKAQREQRAHLKPTPTHTSTPKDAQLQLSEIRDIMEKLINSNDANVECKICLGPMKDAHVSPDCLHRFCGKCFSKSIDKCKSECPLCRVHLSSKRSLRQDRDYDVLVS